MTIHLRLSLLFTALVGFIVVLFSGIMFFAADVAREQNFYEQIEVRANVAADVALEADEIDAAALQTAKRRLRNSLPFERIYIADSVKNIIFTTDSATSHVNRTYINKAFVSGKFSTSEHDTQTVYLRYFDNNSNFIIVATAFDLSGYAHLEKLRVNLIIGCLLAPLVVFGAGWWFSRSMLSPMEAMTKQAENITSSRLHLRIDEGNGKDELAHLARAFNSSFSRLETAFNLQKQFVAHASHELRTPLTILEGEVEVALLSTRSVAEYRNILESVLENVRRLHRLSNDLLALARIENPISEQKYSDVNLDELLFAAIDEIERRFPAIKFTTQFSQMHSDEESFAVKGNSEQLTIALLNILENAAKYSPEGGSVRINLATLGHAIECSVLDTGIGINKNDLPHIFNSFYRSEHVRHIAGNGIGLSLVKTIIERHHGEVSAESSPEERQGTRITLLLPRAHHW